MSRPQASSAHGAVMVEFAIIVPLLILLVFGIIQIGRALYQENTLDKAVASAGRYMARSYDILDMTPDEDGNPACTPTAAWFGSDGAAAKARNLAVYGSQAGGGAPLLPNLDAPNAVTITASQATPIEVVVGGSSQYIRGCVIRVDARADFDSGLPGNVIVPLLEWAGLTLNAATEERYIGE